MSDQTVWCWGANDVGQLGDGTTTKRACAAPVLNLTGVTQIISGESSSCALSAKGVSCWGWNNSGQLGDGSTTARTMPETVHFFPFF
jgi:alpha-tubulin suppressor-like RCC1 family protein